MEGKTRCKVKCISVTNREPDHEGRAIKDVEFYFVSGCDSEENKKFWEASPSGSLKFQYATNIEFEPGKEYYLDIVPA